MFYAQVDTTSELCIRGANRTFAAEFIACGPDTIDVIATFASKRTHVRLRWATAQAKQEIKLESLQHICKTTASSTVVFRFPAETSVVPDSMRKPEFSDMAIATFNVGLGATFESMAAATPFCTDGIALTPLQDLFSSYIDKPIIASTTLTVVNRKHMASGTSTPGTTPPPSPQTPASIRSGSLPKSNRYTTDYIVLDVAPPTATAVSDRFILKLKNYNCQQWSDIVEPGTALMLINVGLYGTARGPQLTAFDSTTIRAISLGSSVAPTDVEIAHLGWIPAVVGTFMLRDVSIKGTIIKDKKGNQLELTAKGLHQGEIVLITGGRYDTASKKVDLSSATLTKV